jgi:glycine/D-amino acid oxidase-like deaminating enzyme
VRSTDRRAAWLAALGLLVALAAPAGEAAAQRRVGRKVARIVKATKPVRGAVGRPTARRRPTVRRPSRLLAYARTLFRGGATPGKVRWLATLARGFADPRGRAPAELAAILQAIDRELGDGFDGKTTQAFQGLLGELGVTTHRAIVLPADATPYWLTGKQPLADYQSSPDLPDEADVVIVGAGLTGASTAYHLAEAARAKGLKVVVLDGGNPANQASGRNGGNFELLPENFLGVYQGLEQERYKYLKAVYPQVDDATLRTEATRQAKAVLGFTSRNKQRFVEIIESEKLEVDFSPKGWLRIAETATEEQGIADEVALGRSLGLDMKLLSKAEIKARTGIDAPFGGRLTTDGNYHPFKYVTALLQKAIGRGVKLYTGTPVETITSDGGDGHLVKTARGTIKARNVVMATNAFTREVLPELSGIEPYQSQIIVTEHAPVAFQGLVTMRQGDLYAHYRDDSNRYDDADLAEATGGAITQRSPFLQGGGLDRPFKDPRKPRRSTKILTTMLADRDQVAPGLKGQPPSRAWTGPMAFTRDRLPAVGFLRKGLIVVAGFNGYGGSYTTAAGLAAADMALSGQVPGWVPQDVFSPQRLLTSEPVFASAATP